MARVGAGVSAPSARAPFPSFDGACLPPTIDGRQITAARALAELTVAELAEAAGVTTRTVNRLEVGGIAHVSPKKRHGHVSRAVLDKIIAALEPAGVELLPQGSSFGAGVRWRVPRERR